MDRRNRFQIRDLLAMVVGYGMAAVFVRAFWPVGGPAVGLVPPALAFYLWLGMALSGPVLLGRPGAGARTWAEWAWLFAGSYWVVLGLFVIPARLREFGAGDVVLFGLVPIVAAVGFRLVGPSTTAGPPSRWTHRAAVWLMATWPVAWGCLVYVGLGLK